MTRVHVMLGALTKFPRNTDVSLTTSRVRRAMLENVWSRSAWLHSFGTSVGASVFRDDVCPKDLPLEVQIGFLRRKMVRTGFL